VALLFNPIEFGASILKGLLFFPWNNNRCPFAEKTKLPCRIKSSAVVFVAAKLIPELVNLVPVELVEIVGWYRVHALNS
jgi:hypothetical protein